VSYLGKRNGPSAEHFMAKVAHAMSHFPYQLTTDGCRLRTRRLGYILLHYGNS